MVFVFFHDWPLYAEIWLIRQYRALVAPTLGRTVHCRFQPTCSQYALQTLPTAGFWKGNSLIALRLLHCTPAGAAWDRLTQPAAP